MYITEKKGLIQQAKNSHEFLCIHEGKHRRKEPWFWSLQGVAWPDNKYFFLVMYESKRYSWRLQWPGLEAVPPMLQFTRQIGLLWNRLPQVKKLWAGGLNLGYFSSVCPWQLFFPSNLPVSCQFREFLSRFNVQEHFFFHKFLGLRCLGKQLILIIHFTWKSTI